MTTVLLVMKQPGNLRVLQQALEPLGFASIGILSAEQLGTALAGTPPPHIGLVDVSGFGPAALQICESLHARGVRFVVLSAPQQAAAGGRALSCGAASVLEKPVARSALLQLLASLAR